MKQSEQIIKESKDKITYLFNCLYRDDTLQQNNIEEIIQCVNNINKAQSVIDKSYVYPENTPKEIISFTETWNDKYIPLYEELINIYYDVLESYQKELFNTSWKDLNQVERIRAQYKELIAMQNRNYYGIKKGFDFGDYYCIRDFILGRDRQNAIDYMKRDVRVKGIVKANNLMSSIKYKIGDIKDYSINEDTDGVSGIIIGNNGRAMLSTNINDNVTCRVFTYMFTIDVVKEG